MSHLKIGLSLFSIVLFLMIGILMTGVVFAQEPVTLEFWLRDTRPSNVEALNKIVQLFESKNPGIKINVVLTPWDSVEQKTMTAIAAGTLPDLAQLNQTGAADYGAKGILLDLEDRFANWERKEEIANISLSQAKYEGKYYAVPWFAGSNVMFYNKDLFINEGIVDENGEAKPPSSFKTDPLIDYNLLQRKEEIWGDQYV
jgi:ABC-type glycerol-3-phosphate transport system substrate-binding protein